MNNFKSFINTTFLGGLLILLPLIILIIVFNGFYTFIAQNIRPFTQILIETARLSEFLASLLSVFFILGLSFLTGLIVKTRFGNIAYNIVEENILKRIPGYRIIKGTVAQIFGAEKNLFLGVALVRIFGNETLMTAFITETHSDGSFTVFVPSGPAPTAGFIYHLKPEFVHPVDYSIELAMKTIISLGAGSDDIYNAYKKSLLK
jgi:uncharacterized membrane protein